MTLPSTRELQVSRLLNAPRDEVFRAWTDPERIKQWWGPIGMSTPAAQVDLRPGGAYRFVMEAPEGPTLVVAGSYREVTPPSRLVYTWHWENGIPDSLETLVTVEFDERGAQTEIRITHGGFPAEGAAPQYQVGWEEALARLATFNFKQ
jgi:uncharacterized protein YndB with AHSA1/START domain